MRIGQREIGPGHPTYIIGEVGMAHDGSVNRAHEFIDAIADAGASAVKFQCHQSPSANEEWRVEPAYQAYSPETRYSYWRRTAFAKATWHALAAHCRDREVDFLCSPFDMAAFEILREIVPAWKVASGQVTNHEMLSAMAVTGKPLLISTGMTTYDEVFRASAVIGWHPRVYLQCTSKYPCPASEIGLGNMKDNVLLTQGALYGLSDHSGTIYPSLAAVALGASVIEVHVRLSNYERTPDSSSSLTPDVLGDLVRGVDIIRQALRPVDKDEMAQRLWRTRDLFLYRDEVKA